MSLHTWSILLLWSYFIAHPILHAHAHTFFFIYVSQILLIILNHVWCCSRWHDTMVFTSVRFRWNNWSSFISALTAIFAFRPKYFSLTEFRPKYFDTRWNFFWNYFLNMPAILKLFWKHDYFNKFWNFFEDIFCLVWIIFKF